MVDTLIFIILSVIAYFCAEIIYSIVMRLKKVEVIYEGDYNRMCCPNPILGYSPEPDNKYHAVMKRNGKKVYDCLYTFDEYIRRITPSSDKNFKTKFALFFGCSFTIGEGVNDDETMPHYFSECMPYMSYNYGFPGYGPQNMLAKLQDKGIRAEMPERDGILIYTFIDDHICRAIGSMRVYNEWATNLPYYILSNGKLTRKGLFGSASRWWWALAPPPPFPCAAGATRRLNDT